MSEKPEQINEELQRILDNTPTPEDFEPIPGERYVPGTRELDWGPDVGTEILPDEDFSDREKWHPAG